MYTFKKINNHVIKDVKDTTPSEMEDLLILIGYNPLSLKLLTTLQIVELYLKEFKCL